MSFMSQFKTLADVPSTPSSPPPTSSSRLCLPLSTWSFWCVGLSDPTPPTSSTNDINFFPQESKKSVSPVDPVPPPQPQPPQSPSPAATSTSTVCHPHSPLRTLYLLSNDLRKAMTSQDLHPPFPSSHTHIHIFPELNHTAEHH
jgi:hypothetical protein